MGKKDLKKLTSQEAREIGKAGGLASVKARRKRKAIKELLRVWTGVLIGDIEDQGVAAELKAAGGNDSMTVGELFAYSCIMTAIKGNAAAMRLVLEILGEDPLTELKKEEIKLRTQAMKITESEEATVIILPSKEE